MRGSIAMLVIFTLGCGNAVETAGRPDTATDPDADPPPDGPVTVEPSDTQITDTDSASLSDELSVAWTGSEFAMTWVDDRDGNAEIYFVRLTPLAEVIEGVVRITDDGGGSVHPSLVWNGSLFGLAWTDDRDGNPEIYLALIDADGVQVGDDIRLTDDSGASEEPSLAWGAGLFVVAFSDDRDGNPEIYVVTADGDGSPGADARITDSSFESSRPDLAYAVDGFGMTWDDDRDGNHEIYFARLSRTAEKVGDDVRITDASGLSVDSSLAWAWDQYGVAWTDHRDGNDEVYFARISPDGEKLGEDVRISDDMQSDREPFLAWTGYEFGLARAYWHGYSDILFTQISADGSFVGEDLWIPDGEHASSYQPALAFSGTEFGLGLMEYRDFDFNVFFNRIGYSGSP
jgi:Tol biopolymer transport system component